MNSELKNKTDFLSVLRGCAPLRSRTKHITPPAGERFSFRRVFGARHLLFSCGKVENLGSLISSPFVVRLHVPRPFLAGSSNSKDSSLSRRRRGGSTRTGYHFSCVIIIEAMSLSSKQVKPGQYRHDARFSCSRGVIALHSRIRIVEVPGATPGGSTLLPH